MGIEAALLKKKVHYTKKEIKMGMVIIRKGINVVAGFSLRSSKERNLKVATTSRRLPRCKNYYFVCIKKGGSSDFSSLPVPFDCFLDGFF